MFDVNMFLEKIAIGAVEQLVNDIKTKQIERVGARGRFASVVDASGKLANSITYTIQNGVMTIWGNDYIYYLQNGRKSGKKPPRAVIRQWIDDKGIQPDGISKDSLAYLIQRRIGNEGTTIYQAGGSDLVSSVVEDLQATIEDEFFGLLSNEINSEILKIAS